MISKELTIDKDWLIKACGLMKKHYEEQLKLVRQNQKIIDDPIFTNHVVMKQRYVISYIQAFPGVDQVVIKELSQFGNPTQFKNGILVLSSKLKSAKFTVN